MATVASSTSARGRSSGCCFNRLDTSEARGRTGEGGGTRWLSYKNRAADKLFFGFRARDRVGSQTSSHVVMLSEESHFPVVLGRAWMEKMGVETDALEPTSVTLRPHGKPAERVECDLVVVRDGKGGVVTVT
jgi:hypothetical protein